MPRLSTGSDKKLIKAGIALAKKRGLKGFTVREVCAKSKVNLGMFHYHFGTKDNFDNEVLNAIYSIMLESINLNISPAKTPKENVRIILRSICGFLAENKVLLSALAGDVFSGNENVITHISKNFTMHIEILRQELQRAQKAGQLAVPSLLDAMLLIVGPFAVPNLVFGLMQRIDDSLFAKLRVFTADFVFDINSQKRMDLIINLVFKED